MKHYLKNLFLALTGSTPFLVELEEAKEQLGKSAENMSAIQNQLYSALEKWESATYEVESYKKDVRGYQQLTENLRERIADKDRLIAALEEELSNKK